ncbi:head-tail joining protein [Burkholderia cenocepacia]|uniref:head-tail joining protein n=1 Tax=Burkholderia cenocepacia TaxID=95486 RepID=UPI0013E0AA13|nr:hypothetical protein [Burkholderia cenocepacia]MCW3583934.1 hypothetical protein [Burkholderia cenocepacia]MCW3629627.1 hypothetical protein [Burkholderia cenocepacia]MCW5182655.1 hypothetical protein [Burkholderia cenocepacia]NGO98910.1 hypothetical protein [Burkholderia cenocepacia]
MFDFDQLNASINGVFGESVSYQPAAGGAPFAVTGVVVDSFRTPYYKDDGSVGYTTTAPAIGVRLADFPAKPVKNDVLTRLKTGDRFMVLDVHSDGIGWLNLILKVAK